MALPNGTRLGSYEVVAALGAGGMGEVYRARDSKLKREVAIKVLPESFAQDPDRLARFQREAELLAALNHPTIAAVYGLEQADGLSAIVLELVEGQTLAETIAHGSGPSRGLPLEEALTIARQLAEALEAAHEKGIVHRDLKPANIKITPEGKVKVLDFGLAKAMEPDGASGPGRAGGPGGLSLSPTLSVHATYAGVILGTAAYMSPEQARGKPVDRRTDIWAFGCVLFEMLTGRQTFDAGETVSDAVAAVLKNDPDWSALPSDTPAHIRTLLRRCLQKDVQKRLPHIGIARIEIDEGPADAITSAAPIASSPATAVRPLWRRTLPVAVTAIVAVALTSVAAWLLRPSAAPPRVTRFPMVLPDEATLGGIAIAPDGGAIVTAGRAGLRVRQMADIDAKVIAAAADLPTSPFFSPDGQWVGYYAFRDRAFKKVAITGGTAVTICKADLPYGARWENDNIYYGQNDRGIFRVSADGGEPEVVIPLKLPEVADTPQLLDGGKTILFTLASESGADRWDKAQVVVQPLPSGARKVIFRGGSNARYTASGHLLVFRQGVLLAVPFDVKTLQTRGGPVPVVEGLMGAVNPGARPSQVPAAISASGTLVYVAGTATTSATPKQLRFVDRTGKAESLPLPPAAYSHPRFSPDGKHLAYDTEGDNDKIVWVYDLGGGAPPRRLTFGGRNSLPVWTSDGRRITFRSERDANDSGIYWQPADGTGVAERLIKADTGVDFRPEAWTPDGKTLAFLDGRGTGDIFTLTPGADQKPKPLVQTPVNERYAAFSPDGRWFSYSATGPARAQGDFQIFVEPYPPTGAKYQLPTEASRNLVWSYDGRQAFYFVAAGGGTQTGRLAVVDVRTQPSFSFGKPTPLPIEGAVVVADGTNYDVTPDGKRFVVVMPVTDNADPAKRPGPQINVVLNWMEELKQRVPVK
jgi:Tol biopolymer transport system component